MKEQKPVYIPPKTSMIISTYNRPDALNLSLQSVLKQRILPNEIVIGDDGSTEDTAQLIRRFQAISPIDIIHVWQEDKGYRLAKSRNKCVAHSKCEYIIQIDGDLVLHRRFVEDHLWMAQKGCFIRGHRTHFTPKRTAKLCASGLAPEIRPFSRGIPRWLNTIHSFAISRYLSTRYRTKSITAQGCNLSFWKEDFININGYDENYEGWGSEDSDLALRLLNSGIKRLDLKFAGIIAHLWHEERSMYNREKNFSYYGRKVYEKAVRCERGVEQYL